MVAVTVDMDVVDLRDAQGTLVTGEQVDNLQGLLKGTRNPAWDPGPIDALGGPRTRAAILAFQEDNSLEADAIVGPLTWASSSHRRCRSRLASRPTTARGRSPSTPSRSSPGVGPQSPLKGWSARW